MFRIIVVIAEFYEGIGTYLPFLIAFFKRLFMFLDGMQQKVLDAAGTKGFGCCSR